MTRRNMSVPFHLPFIIDDSIIGVCIYLVIKAICANLREGRSFSTMDHKSSVEQVRRARHKDQIQNW